MYNHAPEDYRCPLCAIANDEIEKGPLFSPADLVHSSQYVYAMISAFQWPNNPGNVVVIPKAHYENIYDLPAELAQWIHGTAQQIALAMKVAWKCDGVSTRQHNEPAGNQDTWHYHMHVTPRFHGDNLYREYASGKALMPADERAKYANELIPFMKGPKQHTA
jgi:histidine triad (HIT) family protein